MKVRFTRSQLEMFQRAHPDADLEGLLDVAFEFDRRGNLVDAQGTVQGGGEPRFLGNPWLARLAAAARSRFARRPADGEAAVVSLDERRLSQYASEDRELIERAVADHPGLLVAEAIHMLDEAGGL